uniref:hypothetical protein n=1 Tax=uncultured Acinetobacter sp. TaxID=165433 RepID=UPI00262DFFA5|nr:hypothetical protein [uncultured Acinetobacter sp.]
MLILAFFTVFAVGVCACFCQAYKAFAQFHIFTAILNILIAVAGIGGLFQATISAGVL